VGKTRVGVVAGIVAFAAIFVGVADATVGAHPITSQGTNGRVNAIAFAGNVAYIGGAFTTAGTVTRNHAAAISLTTGNVIAFNPNLNGSVQALAVSGNTVFLGGSFTQARGSSAARLVAVNATTGAVIWKATLNGQVMALDVAHGNVYAGGFFTTANGSARLYLAAFNATNGALSTTWKPSADLEVKALSVTSDQSEVIIGGDFTQLNDQPGSHLGAVSATTGANVSWHTHPHYQVITMAADANGIFVGGGGGGGNFAKFSQSGSQQWSGGTDGNVQGITELGGTVYVGGHYENYCGPGGGQHICTAPTPRNKLLAVSTSNGAIQSWDPSANSVLGVFSLAGTGATIGVGGDFTSTGQRPQQHFALYK
jgi:hypothetical protein